MVNFKNVMSLSLALSVILSASQAEAMKRSWEKIYEYENFEAAAAAAREPQFYDHDELEDEPSLGISEMFEPAHQGTVPRFLIPGFSEWCNSEDHKRALFEEDTNLLMAENRARWLSEAIYHAEQARLAAAAQAQVTLEDPQPDEMEDFNAEEISDTFDEEHLKSLNTLHSLEYLEYLDKVWSTHPRPPVWPIMDPAGIPESKTFDAPNIPTHFARPFNTPGDSSDSDSSRKSSVDLSLLPADGYETDSDRENDNREQPQKGKRHGSVKLPASQKFVEIYKNLSTTLSGRALKKEVMKALGIKPAAYARLLGKTRYDGPDAIKPAKRSRRKS